MEIEGKSKGENDLDVGQPGFKFNNEKHKKLIDEINNQVLPVFEKVNKHPENNSAYKLRKGRFFGAHPISLEKKYLKEIKDNFADFLVCEKSDGTRYLMYISNFGEVYLSGRGDDFYLINMPIPPSMVKQKDNEMTIMYIFDGELIIDEREGKKWMVYLMFDALMFNEELVFDKTYAERLKYCLQFSSMRGNLLRLGRDLKSSQPGIIIDQIKRTKQPRVKIAVKDFFQVDACSFIFEKMVPRLPHENDGLIFTRNSKPYPVGATSSIIKWKPPEYNTIDFLVVNNVTWEPEYGKRILDLYVTRYNRQTEETEYVLFDVMVADEEVFNKIGDELDIREMGDDIAYKNAGEADRKKVIAECKFDAHHSDETYTQLLNNYLDKAEDNVTELLENSALSSNLYSDDDVRNNLHLCFDKKIKYMKGNWVLFRIRSDKNAPNAFNTARNVFSCIFEDIGINEIEKEISSAVTQPEIHNAPVNGKQQRQGPPIEEEPDLVKKYKHQ